MSTKEKKNEAAKKKADEAAKKKQEAKTKADEEKKKKNAKKEDELELKQKKTKECMEVLEKFTGETGVYNDATGELDNVKFMAMREKIVAMKDDDIKAGVEEAKELEAENAP